MALTHVLNTDAIAIDALLLATLQDHIMYKQLVRWGGQEAQALLNLLQAVCHFEAAFALISDEVPETASEIPTG